MKHNPLFRPHTEQPLSVPATALIASWDEDGRPYLDRSPFHWNGSDWHRESDGKTPAGEFFWALESDLLSRLPGATRQPELEPA